MSASTHDDHLADEQRNATLAVYGDLDHDEGALRTLITNSGALRPTIPGAPGHFSPMEDS